MTHDPLGGFVKIQIHSLKNVFVFQASIVEYKTDRLSQNAKGHPKEHVAKVFSFQFLLHFLCKHRQWNLITPTQPISVNN